MSITLNKIQKVLKVSVLLSLSSDHRRNTNTMTFCEDEMLDPV